MNYGAKVFNMVEVLLADVLSFGGVKIKLIITFVHQLIGTYDGLLKLEELF